MTTHLVLGSVCSRPRILLSVSGRCWVWTVGCWARSPRDIITTFFFFHFLLFEGDCNITRQRLDQTDAKGRSLVVLYTKEEIEKTRILLINLFCSSSCWNVTRAWDILSYSHKVTSFSLPGTRWVRMKFLDLVQKLRKLCNVTRVEISPRHIFLLHASLAWVETLAKVSREYFFGSSSGEGEPRNKMSSGTVRNQAEISVSKIYDLIKISYKAKYMKLK
jgi:hypothetical protein